MLPQWLLFVATKYLGEVSLAVGGSFLHILEATQHLGLHVVRANGCGTAADAATAPW